MSTLIFIWSSYHTYFIIVLNLIIILDARECSILRYYDTLNILGSNPGTVGYIVYANKYRVFFKRVSRDKYTKNALKYSLKYQDRNDPKDEIDMRYIRLKIDIYNISCNSELKMCLVMYSCDCSKPCIWIKSIYSLVRMSQVYKLCSTMHIINKFISMTEFRHSYVQIIYTSPIFFSTWWK